MKKYLNIKKVGLILIPYLAFISLGLPDGLLGVAWPGIRNKFDQPIDALGVILICGTSGYMISSFFNGIIIRYIGIGFVLSFSCFATAFTLFVFSQTQSWLIFIIFSFFGGLGAGAIDSVINTYVDKYHSISTMQWLHASFGIGITLGPIIMTMGLSFTSRWEIGYIFVSSALVILAFFFFVTRKIWIEITLSDQINYSKKKETSLFVTLKEIPVLLSMLMFFLYTGFELGFGYWIYSLLTESRNISPGIAGIMASSYWAMFTVGRIIAGCVSKFIDNIRLIFICVSLALFGIFLLITNFGEFATIIGIALAGFSVAPIFPGMVSNTLKRVGNKHHLNSIGLQMSSAGFGIAVIPSIGGIFAKYFGIEIIPFYLFIILTSMLFVFTYLNYKNL